MPRPRYLLVGNPGSPRVERFREAIRSFDVDFHLIPWSSVIRDRGKLAAIPEFDAPAIVRLESPGRDPEVARSLIACGLEAVPQRGPVDWRNLEFPRGRLVHPRLLYEGFKRVLLALRESFASRPHLRVLSGPLDVVEMFDKNATCERFEMLGLPTPERIRVEHPWEAWEKIALTSWPVVFVKLNTGSSASGIVQIRSYPPNYLTGLGSIFPREGHFYNTRRLSELTEDSLREVLEFLTGEGACFQRSVRKTEIDGMNFDVRVVMIDRRPRFTVFRVSPNPMTNLHLGGARGDETRCRQLIPQRNWLDAMDHCVALSESYPCQSIGIDLLFERGSGQPYFLEVNAFGDFFPDYRDAKGKTIHEVEIESALAGDQ